MPQDLLDMNCGDTVGHQVRCVRVTKRVRRCADIKPGEFPIATNCWIDLTDNGP